MDGMESPKVVEWFFHAQSAFLGHESGQGKALVERIRIFRKPAVLALVGRYACDVNEIFIVIALRSKHPWSSCPIAWTIGLPRVRGSFGRKFIW